MTTIAYKDGIISSDAQATCGSISVGNVNKLHYKDNKVAGLSGASVLCDIVAEELINGNGKKKPWYIPKFLTRSVNGIFIDGDKTWLVDCGYLLKVESGCLASGSGEHLAIGAMLNGASSTEAVRIAIKKDIYSNLPIAEYNTKTKELKVYDK